MELYQRNIQIRHCNFIYHKFWKFPLWGIVLVFLPNNWSQTRFTEKPSLATNWNVESIHKGLMWGWGLVLGPISDPIEYSSILQFESPIVGIRLLIVVLVLFWLCFLLIPAFCPPLNSIKAPKVAVAFPPLNLIIVYISLELLAFHLHLFHLNTVWRFLVTTRKWDNFVMLFLEFR